MRAVSFDYESLIVVVHDAIIGSQLIITICDKIQYHMDVVRVICSISKRTTGNLSAFLHVRPILRAALTNGSIHPARQVNYKATNMDSHECL
jgi:hypothetical protein